MAYFPHVVTGVVDKGLNFSRKCDRWLSKIGPWTHRTEIKRKSGVISTHRASQEHLDEEDNLLPRSQQAQVDCSETVDGCGTDAHEEGIDVGYIVCAIRSV